MFSSQNSQVSSAANYIEECFSTYLYTGNGSTQTITNGIDLSTKGGLVWFKSRSGAYNHALIDTARGGGQVISSNTTSAQADYSPQGISAFNTNGFTFGTTTAELNNASNTYVSWTFRKQPKFFDVVTYTGNGSAPRDIAHNLGSVPGCIMIKRTDTTSTWTVYHAGIGNTKALFLNADAAADTNSAYWNNTTPTSTVFTLGGTFGDINASGGSYVAYLFAHNAGGFGLTGTDNVISCGSYVGTEARLPITLGYEPQWVMIKDASTGGTYKDWYIFDNMRKLDVSNSGNAPLLANSSAAEGGTYASSAHNLIQPTSTGMIIDPSSQGPSAVNTSGDTFIYIAIRRGPMKVPTSGTSVYEGTTRTGTGAAASISGLSFPPDAVLTRNRDSNGSSRYAFYDKLRGPTIYLDTAATDSEFTIAQSLTTFNQTGESFGTGAISNYSGDPYINWQFRRAPSFFDEVCYTGTGSNTNFSHNLNVAPQLIILKNRVSAVNWFVPYSGTSYMVLNGTSGGSNGSGAFDLSLATASTFWLGADGGQGYNGSGQTYVAYLFATCAGVSKVGSYTGTGTTKQIDCGFTGGARFVLIKRTDSTGDWYVWDTARGIVSGNDPYLLLNSTAAETTGTDYIDPYSAGFEISSTAPAAINASGGTFIFLAIA